MFLRRNNKRYEFSEIKLATFHYIYCIALFGEKSKVLYNIFCFVPQFSLSKNQLCSLAFVHGWSPGEVVKAAAPSQIFLFQISGSNMDGKKVQGESFELWYVWKGFYENKSSRETHTCPQRRNA